MINLNIMSILTVNYFYLYKLLYHNYNTTYIHSFCASISEIYFYCVYFVRNILLIKNISNPKNVYASTISKRERKLMKCFKLF